MTSHEVVTTLVSALHTNIDSIHATLQSLSSHPTHEAELQRLASEREAKIFDLRTAHAQALQVLANQRLKEQDELEAQRQKEVEELEERRRKEWEEVLRKRAKEDEERQQRIRDEEAERERIKQEEDECREAEREERELKLAEDIERELERVEDEIEAKVEQGKQALRELDEKRRAINAEIDKALNMSTVIPKIQYRSRTRTLSRAGTMEQPSLSQHNAENSVIPPANKEVQTPEPGAWLGKVVLKGDIDGTKELDDTSNTKVSDRPVSQSKDSTAIENGEGDGTKNMSDAPQSKSPNSSDEPPYPTKVLDIVEPKDNINDLPNGHSADVDNSQDGFSMANAIDNEAVSREVPDVCQNREQSLDPQPEDSSIARSDPNQSEDAGLKVEDPNEDTQSAIHAANSTQEQDQPSPPPEHASLDTVPPKSDLDADDDHHSTSPTKNSEHADINPGHADKSRHMAPVSELEDMDPKLQIKNLDVPFPSPEPETDVIDSTERVLEEDIRKDEDTATIHQVVNVEGTPLHDRHDGNDSVNKQQDELHEQKTCPTNSLEHGDQNNVIVDSGVEPSNVDARDLVSDSDMMDPEDVAAAEKLDSQSGTTESKTLASVPASSDPTRGLNEDSTTSLPNDISTAAPIIKTGTILETQTVAAHKASPNDGDREKSPLVDEALHANSAGDQNKKVEALPKKDASTEVEGGNHKTLGDGKQLLDPGKREDLTIDATEGTDADEGESDKKLRKLNQPDSNEPIHDIELDKQERNTAFDSNELLPGENINDNTEVPRHLDDHAATGETLPHSAEYLDTEKGENESFTSEKSDENLKTSGAHEKPEPLDLPTMATTQIDVPRVNEDTDNIKQPENKHDPPPQLGALGSWSSDDHLFSPLPKDTSESESAFQSTPMTPVASSDNLIKNELESQQMMLPFNDALEGPKDQQTPVTDHSRERTYDPMSDILWGRSPKDQQTLITNLSRKLTHDPMSDILWGRSLKDQQTPITYLSRKLTYDPMSDILWGRSPKDQQTLITNLSGKLTHDPMSDILWGRSSKDQQIPITAVSRELIHDPMSDILWGRSQQTSITDLSKKLTHDPMSDFLWGRSRIALSSVHGDRELNTSPSDTNTELQGEHKPHKETETPESRVNSFKEEAIEDAMEDAAKNHGGPLTYSGSWPLATRRDLVIDHGEENLSTSSIDGDQSVENHSTTSSQPHVNEARHASLPGSPSNHLGSHDSGLASPRETDLQSTDAEQHPYPFDRHHDGEPWPLRDTHHRVSLNNGSIHEQDDYDASENVSEGSDNWSESDDDAGPEPAQHFGSLRPNPTHRMTNEDEYLPRSARNIEVTDSEDDMTFEEKYGVPRSTTPIRSLSRIDNHPESPHTGPDVNELFDDEDDSEDESSAEYGARDSYPEDLADQYFQRADTPLEVVPEHEPLTEFNDSYAAHRSSGLFANLVDAVRSDIPAVRQVQRDNYQPGAEYALGNATRPRAVSFEDEDPESNQTSAPPHESSLHVRTHTPDTVPSFESYAQSDSIPTTPSETSSSLFMDNPHDEPIIRDSGRERGMTETSQPANELILETPKEATFDPSFADAYPSYISPKTSYANLREDHHDSSLNERANAGYGSFGAQTGLEAHRAEISPVKEDGSNTFVSPSGVDTSQVSSMASNNPFKASPLDQNSPGSSSNRTPTTESPFQATKSLPRTPPRLSFNSQSSSSPTPLNGSLSSSPGLSKRPPPPVPSSSPENLFAKTRSVFELASPQGSPALAPSPIAALSAIRHNSPPLPPPARRSVGSRPSSLHISEPVNNGTPQEKQKERNKELEEEAFMPRSLDGNNKPPSPVFIPSRSGSVSSLRKEDDDQFVKKRSSNPFLGGLSRFVGGIQAQGLDDSVHNPAREPLLKHGDEH